MLAKVLFVNFLPISGVFVQSAGASKNWFEPSVNFDDLEQDQYDKIVRK